MLNRLKSLLGAADKDRQSPAPVAATLVALPGYHAPQSAEDLCALASRKVTLHQLWENSSLPPDLYRQFYLTPVQHLLTRVQNIPATQSGIWAGAGGYGDMVVKFTTCAVRLAKGHLLPPGVAPEEQAAQNLVWNLVVFWGALTRHLPLLTRIEGQLQSGEPWVPGMSVPEQGFRFRFRPTAPPAEQAQSAATLLAGQLIPPGATQWLSSVPSALDCLAQLVCGRSAPLPVIDDILQQAAEKTQSPEISSAVIISVAPALQPVIPVSPDALLSADAPSVKLTSSLLGSDAAVLPADLVSVLSSVQSADVVATALSAGDSLQTSTDAPGSDADTLALLALFGTPLFPEESVPEISTEPESPVETLQPAIVPLATLLNTAEPSLQAPAPQTPPAEPQLTKSPDNSIATRVPAAETLKPGGQSDRGGTPDGEAFWQWLCMQIRDGALPLNAPDSKLHSVAGFVFVPVPDIFFRYLSDSGLPGEGREALQQSFESLNRHRRREDKRFYHGRLYAAGEASGPYKRIKGYLIKASLLPVGADRKEDSRYLVIT